jgi:hypothetical protein
MPAPPLKPPPNPIPGKPPPVQGDVAGTPVQAILVGLAIDVGGSLAIGVALSLLYQLILVRSGLSDAEVKRALAELGPNSWVGVVAMLLGSLCSVAGGFACARIVLRDEWRVGAVMAVLSCLLGTDDGPVDLQALDAACTFACVMLGVMYGERRNRRPAPPPGASPP